MIGKKVRDTLTGFAGTVTGAAQYMDAPDHFRVEGIDATGRPITEWLPASRVSEEVPVAQ